MDTPKVQTAKEVKASMDKPKKATSKPKSNLNKDGFTKGASISPEEYREHVAKLRQKK